MKRKYSLKLWGWPVGLGALWLLFLLVLAIWSVRSERSHVQSMAEREAKTFFKQVVNTRTWNASHGGVYVVATEASPPNEYIMESERTITTEDGILLAKINPAYMTRQISTIAENDRDIRFHITSLDPVRAENAPDDWEIEALQEFNKNSAEKFELVTATASPVFRYMAPLHAKKECMRCHADFGHTGKAILGGISISFPAGPYIQARKSAVANTHMAFTLIFLVGFVGICGSTYLVQRKREEAEQANRTKSVFLANMSHDMRTPLNGIMGLTELMQKKGLDPGQDKYAEMVRHSAWTLLEIITDITDFSRLESGRLELSKNVFNVKDLLDDALSVFAFETTNKGLSLEGHVADDVPSQLKGDAFRLKQVLTNLVGNAVKFTTKGFVRVRISLGEQPPAPNGSTESDSIRLRVEVQDSGVGIPQEEQQLIFESFRQVDGSHYKAHEGTGLGLAICKELISMMQGTISVESQMGMGSTFSFDLVLSVPEDGELETKEIIETLPQCPDCSPCRVLVVDDNSLNQIFASEILTGEGHRVTIAENGREALEAVRNHPFDIVFMDVQMPVMDGLEAARRIRAGEAGENKRSVPIVAITAFALKGDRELCFEAGMNGHIVKPLESRDIISALAQYSDKVLSKEEASVPQGESDAHINVDKALERLGGSRKLFDKLAQTFLVDTPPKIIALEAAVSAKDMDEVLRLSHSLKNSAGMVQAEAMSETALAIEMCMRENRPDELKELHDQFAQSSEEALTALQRIMEK